MSGRSWPHPGGCRICVSLAAPDLDAIDAALLDLRHADLAEIRLDALESFDEVTAERLADSIAASAIPLGFTVRPAWQGGGYRGAEEERRALLEAAVAAGAAFVDVELDAAFSAELVDAAACPVIVSHHWDEARPADLGERIEQMKAIAPAVVKLVAFAEQPADAIPLLDAGRELVAAGRPAACFCMGPGGRASRVLSAGCGAPLVYAAPSDGSAVAPGQWPAYFLDHELRIPDWGKIEGFCGLVGDPIGHSLSPVIFNAVFRQRSLPLAYLPFPGTNLESTLELLDEVPCLGLSVTMPFKEDMAARCVDLEEHAEAMGAVNTVVRTPAGWFGHNTDGPAIVGALAAELPLDGAEVAVVGAGGVARAAGVALCRAGARVTIMNRSPEGAQEVASRAGCAAAPLEVLETATFDAVINATPVGMQGTPARDQMPFPAEWLGGREVLFDLVYRPRITPLLRAASRRGCRTIEGLEMFVRQAAAQYRLLTGDGEDDPLETMREVAIGALADDGWAQNDDGGGTISG